jgi:cytochrome c-type biogenesis protein CcmH
MRGCCAIPSSASLRSAPSPASGRRTARFWLGSLFLILALASPARAVEPGEILGNPALESRARDISTGLRCLVCQNQSIDDSEASLARDLRRLVRERLQQGDSDDQVRAWLVARYGPYILLKPPFDTRTLLLWATPALCLLIGGAALIVALRRRAALPGSAPLDPAEAAAVERIVAEAHRET